MVGLTVSAGISSFCNVPLSGTLSATLSHPLGHAGMVPCDAFEQSALAPLGLVGGTPQNSNRLASLNLWHESFCDAPGALVPSESHALFANHITRLSNQGTAELTLGLGLLLAVIGGVTVFLGVPGSLVMLGLSVGFTLGFPRMVSRIRAGRIMKALDNPARKRALLEQVRAKAEQGDPDAFHILYLAEVNGLISRNDNTADLCLASLPHKAFIQPVIMKARAINDLIAQLGDDEKVAAMLRIFKRNFYETDSFLRQHFTRSQYRKLKIAARLKEIEVGTKIRSYWRLSANYHDPDFVAQVREAAQAAGVKFEEESGYRTLMSKED